MDSGQVLPERGDRSESIGDLRDGDLPDRVSSPLSRNFIHYQISKGTALRGEIGCQSGDNSRLLSQSHSLHYCSCNENSDSAAELQQGTNRKLRYPGLQVLIAGE